MKIVNLFMYAKLHCMQTDKELFINPLDFIFIANKNEICGLFIIVLLI